MTSWPPLELDAGSAAIGEARRTVRRWLSDAQVPAAAICDVQLVATELASNALVHGRPPVILEIGLDDVVRIRVTDHDPQGVPRELPRDPSRIGGHGLNIVAALARDWGVTAADGHKTVWAEVPT